MNIIAVDDEYHALQILGRAIRTALPEGEFSGFRCSEEALEFASVKQIDIAFLDIEMRSMHGLILAKKLKELYGFTNIVFVTGFSQYAMDAFSICASGYITKPVSAEDIRKEIENLRYPLAEENKGIQIRTFGNFEVSVNGEPILFSRSKSKEILAYLVDRSGSGVTVKELANILWEEGFYNRSRQQQVQTYITALKNDLEKAGAGDILVRKRNFLAVRKDQVNCDLYRYRQGDPRAVNAYMGEYMSKYSWGEFTIPLLDSLYPPKKE